METTLFYQVKEIIKTLQLDFPATEVHIDDHVHDYIDSISMLDLLSNLEEAFNIIFEPADINPNDFDTFSKLCDLIVRLQKGDKKEVGGEN